MNNSAKKGISTMEFAFSMLVLTPLLHLLVAALRHDGTPTGYSSALGPQPAPPEAHDAP